MTVSPELIRQFLDAAPREYIATKGRAAAELRQLIYNCSGAEYREADGATRLRHYQLEALAFALLTRHGALMLLEMQLGKSMVALRWAEHLRRAGLWHGRGLVVTHAPVGLDVWAGEARKHSSLQLVGVQNNALELADACETGADLIAIPWTGLQNIFSIKKLRERGARAGQPKLYPDWPLLRAVSPEFSLVIFDEVHRARDPYGLWFQIAAELTRNAQFRLGLTGTPLGRDPLDLWTQLYLIDRGATLGRAYGFFQQAFARREGYGWTFRKRRLPILLRKVEPVSFACRRSEVRPVDIQPAQVELTMSRPQAEAYRGEVGAAIRDSAANAVVREHHFMRLRQIASGFLPYTARDGSERIADFPNAVKLDWLDGTLANLGEARLVIFHDFVHSGELITRLLHRRQISHRWIWGGGKDNPGGIADFQSGAAQVLVANTATGGMSINLSDADYLVFYECPLSARIRAQAEARPLADRELRPLFITDLVAAPIERRILALIREGKDVNASLMDHRALSEPLPVLACDAA